MSYLVQSKVADDGDLRQRVIACAASEEIPEPESWAYATRWSLSTSPGWVDAYASAVSGGDESPGANENAITDRMILAAVQAFQPKKP